jgi:hypothetical protein
VLPSMDGRRRRCAGLLGAMYFILCAAVGCWANPSSLMSSAKYAIMLHVLQYQDVLIIIMSCWNYIIASVYCVIKIYELSNLGATSWYVAEWYVVVVCGTWYVRGTWYLVRGTWYLVRGTLVRGTTYDVRRGTRYHETW